MVEARTERESVVTLVVHRASPDGGEITVAGTVATWLISKLNVPPEYGGIVVSNSETTLDADAFLTLYRCARYGVGCVCRHSERAKYRVLSAWHSARIDETGPPRGSVAAWNDRRAARPCV